MYPPLPKPPGNHSVTPGLTQSAYAGEVLPMIRLMKSRKYTACYISRGIIIPRLWNVLKEKFPNPLRKMRLWNLYEALKGEL
jgi:hypothetical protein